MNATNSSEPMASVYVTYETWRGDCRGTGTRNCWYQVPQHEVLTRAKRFARKGHAIAIYGGWRWTGTPLDLEKKL
jgi:hypothetical protein